MKITEAFESAFSIHALKPLVEQATTEVSFWGTRYICVHGHEGTLSIDSLASRVMDIAEKQRFTFSEEERLEGMVISEKIDLLYRTNDAKVKLRNYFTQLFVYLRDALGFCFKSSNLPSYANSSSKIRWCWIDCENVNETGYNKIFYYYTREQYQAKYKQSPESNSVKFNYPEMWKRLELWSALKNGQSHTTNP